MGPPSQGSETAQGRLRLSVSPLPQSQCCLWGLLPSVTIEERERGQALGTGRRSWAFPSSGPRNLFLAFSYISNALCFISLKQRTDSR